MGNNSSATSRKKKKKDGGLLNILKKQKKNTSKEENYEWILECIVEFAQSAEANIFIDGFVDENCLVFDSNISEINNFEYNQIHLRYKEMIENLLISRLSKMGVTAKQFTESMFYQKTNKTNINSNILQHIIAIHDFNVFQKIMSQRNIELEQEAIKYLSQQNASNTKSVDVNNMSEQQQIEWALSESMTLQQKQQKQQQPQQQEMEPAKQPEIAKSDIVPSAPIMTPEPIQNNNNNNNVGDNNPFEMISNINMSQRKRVSLKPLKPLKKNENLSFEAIKNEEEYLPTLSAASIKNIKLKQSSKENASILKQKQMILNLRKQKRNKEIERMEPGSAWNLDINKVDASNQSNLPPLHKSLFAKISQIEGEEDATYTFQ